MAEQADSAILQLTYKCQGIVLTDDGKCHLFSDSRIITHDGTGGTHLNGHTLWRIPNPPYAFKALKVPIPLHSRFEKTISFF